MKKILFLACSLSSQTWAGLPPPKASCQIVDLQVRYARLFAAGSFCGKTEHSDYAKNLNVLYIRDQKQCKVTGQEIDPTDEQVDQAFDEIDQLPIQQQKALCSSVDAQIKSLI